MSMGAEAAVLPPVQIGGEDLRVEGADTPASPDDFVIINGYRLVKPYHFDYCCSVRQRWFGQNIVDIFTREFPSRDRQYYLQALADGRLRVEGMQVTADTLLRDGQRMRHFIHRHEPPVPAGAIQVVGTSSEAVAVCKPAGMPVHVAGQYRKNTVLGILTAEQPDLGTLLPVHRLDKPVSGLLLFARSPAAAAALCRTIEGRGVEKVYVARVLGRFPEGPVAVDVPLAWDPVTNQATAEPGAAGSAVLEAKPGAAAAGAAGAAGAAATAAATGAKPDSNQQQGGQQQGQQASRQQQQRGAWGELAGLSREERKVRKAQLKQQQAAVKAERVAAAAAAAEAAVKRPSKTAAKPALTEFRLLAVAPDGLTSIVECRPRTGRTHQIRVHLQHLGHPIANDAQYSGTYGGPLASRQMAQALGMHWAGNAQAVVEAAAKAAADAEAATEAAAGGAGGAAQAEGEEEARTAAVAEGESSKRQRLEAPAPAPAGAVAGAAGSDDSHGGSAPTAAAAPPPAATDGVNAVAFAQSTAFRSQPEYQLPAELCDSLCNHCPYFAPRDYPFDLRPLWLHARSYSCTAEGGWSFATELPDWAHSDWQPPGGPHS